MIIKSEAELAALKESGKICAYIRDRVADYLEVGMSTLEADEYAGKLFKETGFLSAPIELYKFPGNICLSVNSCVAHGIPSKDIIIKSGDSVNVDVCGSIGGVYTDCGKSVVVGESPLRQQVCDCAEQMLFKGLSTVCANVKLSAMGKAMGKYCRNQGFYPIKKLTGHGIGNTLHEKPKHIHCCYVSWDMRKFLKGMVVAIETFVSTNNCDVFIGDDGWSWIAPNGAATAQFEHTVVVTDDKPIILTESIK